MQPERVWTVGRSRCEDAGHRDAGIPARMHLQLVAPGQVKPGDHDDLITYDESFDPRGDVRAYVDPRVGCALSSLLGTISATFDRRTNNADGVKQKFSFGHRVNDPQRPQLKSGAVVRPPPSLLVNLDVPNHSKRKVDQAVVRKRP